MSAACAFSGRRYSVLCSLDSTCVGIAGARGRMLYSSRSGDQLGGSRTYTERVAVEAYAELAASAREATLRSPGGQETTRSVDIAARKSEHSLAGGVSAVSLQLRSTSAASVATRRELSLRSIRHDRAARRSDLCIPRLVPSRRFVSDTTVRRLVKRCQEDVANQKRKEDEIEQVRIDVELKQLAAKENERLDAEDKHVEKCEAQAARLTAQTEAAVTWRVSALQIRAADHFISRCPECHS